MSSKGRFSGRLTRDGLLGQSAYCYVLVLDALTSSNWPYLYSGPFAFSAAEPATVTLVPDLAGNNMDVTLTIPIDDTAAFGPLLTWTFEGELILTGRYAIPSVPIPPWAGVALAFMVGWSGRRLASAGSFTKTSSPRTSTG